MIISNSSQYRSLLSLNKPPPGKTVGCAGPVLSPILGSFQPTQWITTNQLVYRAEPVIQRARSREEENL